MALSSAAVVTSPPCPVCAQPGGALYDSLQDRIFDAPGKWQLKRCRNRQCGLVWLCPMPTQEELVKAYQNYYTHQAEPFSASRRSLRTMLRHIYLHGRFGYPLGEGARWYRYLTSLAYVMAFLRPAGMDEIESKVAYLHAPRAGMRLLEIGCGSGEQLAQLAGLGWKVMGVETDPRAAVVAQGRGLEVRVGELRSQDFPDDSFDAILMRHVVEHVAAPVALLQECQRVLRREGVIVVQTPNAASLGHWLFGANWRGLEPPRHLMIHTRGSLKCVAERAGFGGVRVKSSVYGAPHTWQQSAALKKFGHANYVNPPNAWQWFEASVFQFAERALLSVMPDAGEELLLIAKKATPD
jgi:2-polyprenyl-3-methyl-5-hydroxy-6-metoxy-1,4-benzoquinol methylase